MAPSIQDGPVLHMLLRILMRTWHRSRESAMVNLPFPEDAPVARAAGPGRLRALLVGNGAASGWGVRSHELALTGHLARELATRTGRGVQVDARVDRTMRLVDLGRLLTDVDLERYDAIVLLAGMNDSVTLTPLESWTDSMRGLLDRFRSEASGAAVLVLGPQPVRSVSIYSGWPGAIADRHRGALNAATEALCAEREISFSVLRPPSDPPGTPGLRSPGVYGEWAVEIAGLLAPQLCGMTAAPSQGPQPEEARQRATEAMLPDAPPDPGLDRITRLAREVFAADFAAVSLLDGPLQKNRSVSGADIAALPRSSSVCDRTIRTDAPLVIGDLSKDPRFAGNPAVHGQARLRFYAGYPIESPDGYRVGALCVADTEPRDPHDVDTTALARLALLAQKELWASVGRADG